MKQYRIGESMIVAIEKWDFKENNKCGQKAWIYLNVAKKS